MSSRRLVLLAALAAAPSLLGGCALTRRSMEPPKVTLESVTPESATRDGQVFRCRLLLENPNTEDLEVVGGRVTLEIAGVSAGSARPLEGFLVPGLATRQVDLRVTLDLLSSLSGILKLLAAGGTDLEYALKGYVDLDLAVLGRLPFKSDGKVKLETLLRQQVPGLVRPVPPDVAGPKPEA